MIILKTSNYIETEGHASLCVEGFYTCRAIKNGKVVRETTFKNLITNLGMDAIGSNPSFARMLLGTGTTTPAFTDTALAVFGVNVQAAGGVSAQGNSGTAPYYGWQRLTWTSAVGGATGNWTEIGISSQNTNGLLRSRALILDGVGAPTVFPVLFDEQFQGTYEFRIYVPTGDSLASITLSGTPYDTTTRAIQATLLNWYPSLGAASSFFAGNTGLIQARWYSGALAAITATTPGGSVVGSVGATVTSTAYTAGTFQLDSSFRFGSGVSVGVCRTVSIGFNSAFFQVEYSPTITKLTTQELIHNQRIVWARR